MCFCVFVKSSDGRKEAGPPFGWELAMAGRRVSFLFFCDVLRFFQATDTVALDTTSPASKILTKQKKLVPCHSVIEEIMKVTQPASHHRIQARTMGRINKYMLFLPLGC